MPQSHFLAGHRVAQPGFVADQVAEHPSGTGGGAAAPGLHGNGLGSVDARRRGARRPAARPSRSPRTSLRRPGREPGRERREGRGGQVTVGRRQRDRARGDVDTIAAGETKTVTIPLAEPPPDRPDRPDHGRRSAGPGREEDRQQQGRVPAHLHSLSRAEYPGAVDDLTTTQGIVALAAAGVALVALLSRSCSPFKLRAAARRAARGARRRRQRDLVAHARGSRGLRRAARLGRGGADRLEERMPATPSGASTAASPTARSSATTPTARCRATSPARVALLDSHRSGVVVSSILHRDQARVYVKQVHEGEAELELSPEEQRGGRRPRSPQARPPRA